MENFGAWKLLTEYGNGHKYVLFLSIMHPQLAPKESLFKIGWLWLTTRYIKNKYCFVNNLHWTTFGADSERHNIPNKRNNGFLSIVSQAGSFFKLTTGHICYISDIYNSASCALFLSIFREIEYLWCRKGESLKADESTIFPFSLWKDFLVRTPTKISPQ